MDTLSKDIDYKSSFFDVEKHFKEHDELKQMVHEQKDIIELLRAKVESFDMLISENICIKSKVQELEKALELACNDTVYLIEDWLTAEHYINQAREQLKGEINGKTKKRTT